MLAFPEASTKISKFPTHRATGGSSAAKVPPDLSLEFITFSIVPFNSFCESLGISDSEVLFPERISVNFIDSVTVCLGKDKMELMME